MDFLALAECLGASMQDEVAVLVEDPLSVEGQDSAKVGCPSVAAKWWSHFSKVCTCGLSCWFGHTGLKVVFFCFFDRDWVREGW